MKKFFYSLSIFVNIIFISINLQAMSMQDEHDYFSNDHLDQSQGKIKEAIIDFLKKEQTESSFQEEKEAMEKVIHWFKTSGGECVGLSTLWAYGKKLAEKESSNAHERDDIHFFKKIIKKLVSWDRKSDFNQKDKNDIERFISNIRFYQFGFQERQNISYPVGNYDNQLALSNTLVELENGNFNSPILNFKWTATFTKQFLINRLKTIVKPGSMIFLLAFLKSDSGHAMSCYMNTKDKKIYFYDPNLNTGEIEVDSIDELVEKYWDLTNDNNFNQGFGGLDFVANAFRKIQIEVFDFADKRTKYPTENQLNLTAEECINSLNDDFIGSGGIIRKLAKDSNELNDFLKTMSQEEASKIINGQIEFDDELCDEECQKEIIDIIQSKYPTISKVDKIKPILSVENILQLLNNLGQKSYEINSFDKELYSILTILNQLTIDTKSMNAQEIYNIKTALQWVLGRSIIMNRLDKGLQILFIFGKADINLSTDMLDFIDQQHQTNIKEYMGDLKRNHFTYRLEYKSKNY